MALTRLQQDKNILARIDTYGVGLTDAEIEAVDSFLKWVEKGQELTEKQRKWAEDIDEKRVR